MFLTENMSYLVHTYILTTLNTIHTLIALPAPLFLPLPPEDSADAS